MGRRTTTVRAERPSQGKTLGQYLKSLRETARLTLRQVEEVAGREVSNAYLSQLEHGRINQPSPNILHKLAEVYGAPYDVLMEKAGYIIKAGGEDARHDRVAIFANESLTQDEEDQLLEYLAFIRSRSKRRGKTPN